MLADAYAEKPSETREDNLKKAIVHYRLSLDSLARSRDHVLHANLAIRQGLAYFRLSREIDLSRNELDEVVTRLHAALEVFKQYTGVFVRRVLIAKTMGDPNLVQ